MTRFTLLGMPIDPMTEAEAVDWVARAIDRRQPRLIISVNPERIMQARREPEFAAVLRRADLALADGAASSGPPDGSATRYRAAWPGSIFSGPWRDAARARGGASSFSADARELPEAAGEILKRTYPGFRLAGSYDGPATAAK